MGQLCSRRSDAVNTERPDNDDDARDVGGAGSADTPEVEERDSADAAEAAEAIEASETSGDDARASEAETTDDETTAAEETSASETVAEKTDLAEKTNAPEARDTEAEEAATHGADAEEAGPAPEADAETPPAPDSDLPRDEEHPVRPGGGRSRTPAIIASVAAAVLLIGGGGAWLAANASGGSDGGTASGAPGGDDTPPPLALDGYSESTPGGGNGIAPGEPNPYGATYRVDGPLPDGPGEAPVYRARGQVGKEDVARLAKALGVEGTPVAQGEAWKVGAGQDGSGPSLQVNRQAPGAWTFSRYAPGTDDCKGTDTCTTPRSGGSPVSEAEAEKAAAPVLKALGQDDAKLDASQVMGAQRVVNAAPEVGGLPTHGWTTGVTVGSDGEVVGGSGQLKTPVKGDTYPVVGAAKALELMEKRPADHRMGIGGCASPVPLKDRLEQPCGSSASGAPEQDVVTVRNAVFGLASHFVDGRQALVPSWLFEVTAPGAKDPFTVTYPAVDPKYLASPTPSGPSDKPTSAPEPRDVKVDGYRAEGAELTVTFTGGVCADYDVKASESGEDEVKVTVTSTPWPDKICIMIAKQFQKTVQLDEPLGDRAVVGSDGKGVPLAKEGARLPAPPTQAR
jgi:hypothetical protein